MSQTGPCLGGAFHPFVDVRDAAFIQSVVKMRTPATFAGGVCTACIEHPFSWLFNSLCEVILGLVPVGFKIR